MSKNNNAGSGVGFASLLGILFIALKLTGVISWGWFYVLMPLWAPVALLVLFLSVWFVVFYIFKK